MLKWHIPSQKFIVEKPGLIDPSDITLDVLFYATLSFIIGFLIGFVIPYRMLLAI